MENQQTNDLLRPDLKSEDFEYMAIISRNGIVSEVIPFANQKDAIEYLRLAAYEIDDTDVPVLEDINDSSSNDYSIWRLDDMGGRYEDVT